MNKKTVGILLKAGLIFSILAVLLTAFENLIFGFVMNMVFNADDISNNGSSVAIIGGADGPTAIFITGSQSWGLKVFLVIFFTVLAFVFSGLLIRQRRSK